MDHYRIVAHDTDMGVYAGDDADDALDTYARDAGYDGHADLIDRVPSASADDVECHAVQLTRWYGGDAARPRAESYADEHGGTVVALDTLPGSMLDGADLDAYGRDGDGTRYTWGVVQRAG